jgi:glutamate mutase epsilon subunit
MTAPYLDTSVDHSFFKKVYEKSQNEKILSWDLTETKDIGNDYDHLINLNEKSTYNVLSTDINSSKSYYEYDRLEDVEETLENLRTKVSNFPVKLIKGVLNKHNTSLLSSNTTLNKNILFSYRLNNDQIVDKISQIEQF